MHFIDGSGAITAGGTAQLLFKGWTARKSLIVQNQSAGALYFNEGSAAAATPGSIMVAAGDIVCLEGWSCPTGNISIFGATTGQAFTAKQR